MDRVMGRVGKDLIMEKKRKKKRLNHGDRLNVGVREWEAAKMTPGFWTE